MHHALRAGGAVAGVSLLTAFGALGDGARAQDAQGCARPNVAATVIHPALPDTPPMAQQQGITGTVQVVVSLDPNSRVVGTRIQSSPSTILNNAALSAARQSVFQTEIRNCVPIASDYVLTIQFDSVPGSITTVGGGQRPIAVITGQGVASREPDIAYASAGIVTNDDDPSRAAAKNDAIYTRLRTELKALGIEDAAIRNAYFGMSFVPPPAPAPSARPYVIQTPPSGVRTPAPLYRAPGVSQLYGYVANREVTATITDVTKAGAVVDAMRAAGATSVGNVQFVLRDRRAANEEALAAALKDAAAQAQAVAGASRMHVAGIQTIQVGQNVLRPGSQALPLGNLHPAPVEVRATVTVTYVMKP